VLFAQSATVTGKAVDQNGEALPGANVQIAGSTRGVTTDEKGSFTMTDVQVGATLSVSFVGMETKEIVFRGERNLTVVLEEKRSELDEVVVVGYGTQKKGNLTAAISTIQAADIQTTTATSIAHKLQGKMPGLNIRQSNGEPGLYDEAINIRGFGEPLYVIDGIQRPASVFQRINGADIENISVLKDAAAAVYGINAANGVVIVTTKRGGKGKTDFNFSSTVGFSMPTDIPRMSNAYEYITLRNEANINVGLEPFVTKEELEKWKNGGPGYESTDWYGATFNDYSMRQEYNLSAEGGTDKLSYYFNLGGAFDNSILKTNDLFYRRLSFRSNISAQLTDRIKAVVNIAVVNDKRETPRFGIYDIWRGVISSLPIKKVYANDNPLYLNRVQDGNAMNPVAMSSSDLTGYSRSNNNDYVTSLELSYEVPFIKGLELKGIAAYDKAYNMGKDVSKDFALYDYDVETDTYNATKFNDPASISNSYSNVYYTTIRGQADYRTVINNDHNISATLVYEVRDAAGRQASLLKYFDFYTNDQVDQAGNTNAQSGGNEWHTRNMSYIGRANYNYKGRYLIEFAGRYDGSYRYHPDRRWGFFPLVSGGWRVSDEKFMNPLKSVLSNLKLRASYGKIGEDAGDPFQYLPGFTTGGGWWEFSDGKTTLGLNTPAIVNERLSWINSTLTDIGIDLNFFNNKLAVTFDWYQKDRSGLLAYRNVSLPNTYGGSFPQENLNKDRVRGFDFSFDYKNNIGDLSYKVSGNFNYARTTTVYIEQGGYSNSWDIYRGDQIGRYQGVVWNYHVVGQYRSEEEILAGPIQNGSQGNRYVLPGDFIYEDVNGNNMLDWDDTRPQFYDGSPKMNYGLTLGASWKGFDASVLFQGAALFSIRYTGAYNTMFWMEANLPAYFMDRWHKEDPYDPNSSWIPGKWPAMRRVSEAGALYEDSDAWRKDCSYVRLKNIELGYTFPQRYSRKVGLNSLRLFVDVNNIYTWSDSFIKPFDPEKRGGGNDTGWTYPIMRTFNVGVDIHF
jgi:TonB-linked SusC/RagA family outer membrane protein